MSLDNQNTRLRFSLLDTEFKSILNNSFSLLVIQGTNFILPLILLPYLIKVLGIEKFGLISIAQAFISFWIIFTDYGFQISATRDIVLHRQNKEKLVEIVNNTLKTKLFLCLLAFLVYCIAVFTLPAFSKYQTFYLLTFVMVVGQTFIPTWFFQGIEKMHFLTIINFVGKTIFTLLIFFLIKLPAHYQYVTLIYGLGNLVAGVVGTSYMFRRFSIPFRLFKKFNLVSELKSGWHVFLSNFSINLYLNLNILILGAFASEVVVGFYSIAEKVIYVVKMLINIFFQATFPKVCQQKEKGHKNLKTFFKKYFLPFMVFIILISIGLFITADQITVLLAKKHVPEISWGIRLLSVVPIIVCLNTPAYQSLLAYNFQRSCMVVFVSGSFLNVLLNMILVKPFLMAGTIASIIITELFITVGLFYTLYKKYYQSPLFNYKVKIDQNV